MRRPTRAAQRGRAYWPALLITSLMGVAVIWCGCIPIDNNPDDNIPSGNTKPVNQPPTLTFTMPATDKTLSSAEPNLIIAWEDADADDNAIITILLDPGTTPDDGDEIVVLARREEDPDGNVNDSSFRSWGHTSSERSKHRPQAGHSFTRLTCSFSRCASTSRRMRESRPTRSWSQMFS